MRWTVLIGALFTLACGSGDPFCGLPADATGRLIAYCENPREEPVCNEPGMEAHFESGGAGLILVGGQRATCDGDDALVCPLGTEGPPFCLLDPEL